MDPAAEKQAVRVTILSRPYTLRTSGDPREVEAVAKNVDELMLNIAGKAPNADSTHIAVLACLHLADKLRELEREVADLRGRVSNQKSDDLERELAELRGRVNKKSGELAGLLEEVLRP